MIYLLDANVLIDAHRDYYPFRRVPEFWSWLVDAGLRGLIKIPIEVMEEFTPGDGDLREWALSSDVRDNLGLNEDVDIDLVRKVTEIGYASDLNDEEIEAIGRDPFLIAYALAAPIDRVVVSTEASKPSKQRANRRVPDVCRTLGVRPCNTFQMIRELNFSTNWKSI